jgi:hypothetical protein
MMWTITEELIRRHIDRAVRKFCEDQEQPSYLKRALVRLAKKVMIHFNSRIRATWALAYQIHPSASFHTELRAYYKKHMDFDRKQLFSGFDKKKCYYIMTLSPRILQYIPASEVYDTVAHELAHLLQFYRINYSCHDEEWKGYHRSMGCTAEIYIPFDIPLRVFISKKPIKKR